MSGRIYGFWFLYVTRTGALWNGPIKRARFTIRMNERPWVLNVPEEFKVVRQTERLLTPGRPVYEGGRARTEIVFEMRNWTPTADLLMTGTYVPDEAMSNFDLKCPSHYHAEAITQRFDLTSLSKCEQVVHAFHGKQIRDHGLARRVYGDAKSGHPGRVLPRLNRFYTPALLTKWDRSYLDTIGELRRRTKLEEQSASAGAMRSN